MQIAAAGSLRSSPRNPNGSEKVGVSLVISALSSQRRQFRGLSAFSRQASVPWMTSFHHRRNLMTIAAVGVLAAGLAKEWAAHSSRDTPEADDPFGAEDRLPDCHQLDR